MERPLEHFLEKFPFASAPIIAMHFNISHSTVKKISSRELGLRKSFRKCAPHQLSEHRKKCRVDTSVELFALLDQYSELQFERIATGDKSWVCYLIESDSMFARRPEKLIPKFRPRISIKKVMIAVLFTA
jgi:hypothetical protein